MFFAVTQLRLGKMHGSLQSAATTSESFSGILYQSLLFQLVLKCFVADGSFCRCKIFQYKGRVLPQTSNKLGMSSWPGKAFQNV